METEYVSIVPGSDTHKAIETVWRIESPKLIAGLTRIVHDVGLAEDLAMDALVVALEKWPQLGVPDNPGAWLMATAKHRALDSLRRDKMLDRKHSEMVPELERQQDRSVEEIDEAIDDDIGDDLLRLVFMTCHPILSTEARVALTLRLLGGLTTTEIARAFLTSEPTIAQRIVRAKKSLTNAGVPFEVPRGEERSEVHDFRLRELLHDARQFRELMVVARDGQPPQIAHHEQGVRVQRDISGTRIEMARFN